MDNGQLRIENADKGDKQLSIVNSQLSIKKMLYEV